MARPMRSGMRATRGSAAYGSTAGRRWGAVTTLVARPLLGRASQRCRSGGGLLGLPEDLGDLVDLAEQLVGDLGVPRGLGAAATGELGGLVEQLVEVGALLEVRRFAVVGPQHPEVVLDEVGALFLDRACAGLEVRVVVVGDLGHARLHRLG